MTEFGTESDDGLTQRPEVGYTLCDLDSCINVPVERIYPGRPPASQGVNDSTIRISYALLMAPVRKSSFLRSGASTHEEPFSQPVGVSTEIHSTKNSRLYVRLRLAFIHTCLKIARVRCPRERLKGSQWLVIPVNPKWPISYPFNETKG